MGKLNKLIVAIPTRDRPKYLNWTVRSVLEQAREHSHKNVEIVVSDPSSTKENVAENLKRMRALQKQFPETPIHYYGPGKPAPVKLLLKTLEKKDAKTYEKMAPAQGHYGANRNRVALLAVFHGGENAAYLHLDDDTPIATLDERKDYEGRVRKHPKDVLQIFVDEFKTAKKTGAAGLSATYYGVSDMMVSDPPRRVYTRQKFSASDLKHELASSPRTSDGICIAGGIGMGPGRIAGADVMRRPYLPYGVNEDLAHRDYLYSSPKYSAQAYLSSSEPLLLHVGVVGHQLGEKSRSPHECPKNISASYQLKNWTPLVDKMIELGEKERTKGEAKRRSS